MLQEHLHQWLLLVCLRLQLPLLLPAAASWPPSSLLSQLLRLQLPLQPPTVEQQLLLLQQLPLHCQCWAQTVQHLDLAASAAAPPAT
jgi:hypothetical protein